MAQTKLQAFLNSPITHVAKQQRNPKVGDLFGLELECEGRNISWNGKDEEIVKSWVAHKDGSLRDIHGDSCEWVFNGPVKYKAAEKRVHELFDYFTKRKAKLVTSNRTSLHVHFNMADKNVYQLVNMFILWSILDGLMDRFCGEDRVGNLFCLSSRHAEEQIGWMMDSCFRFHNLNEFRNNNRYASMNVAAIHKFGTVEFRGMRGLDNREDVLDWLSILNEFCEYACYKMKNPVDLVEMISKETPEGFLKKIFSVGNYHKLTRGWTEADLRASIYEGMRLVQMLCYKIGTEFDQVRLRGRDFWASFKDDQEPDRDVDPGMVMGQVEAGLNPFEVGGRGVPEGLQQPARGGGGVQRNPNGHIRNAVPGEADDPRIQAMERNLRVAADAVDEAAGRGAPDDEFGRLLDLQEAAHDQRNAMRQIVREEWHRRQNEVRVRPAHDPVVHGNDPIADAARINQFFAAQVDNFRGRPVLEVDNVPPQPRRENPWRQEFPMMDEPFAPANPVGDDDPIDF